MHIKMIRAVATSGRCVKFKPIARQIGRFRLNFLFNLWNINRTRFANSARSIYTSVKLNVCAISDRTPTPGDSRFRGNGRFPRVVSLISAGNSRKISFRDELCEHCLEAQSANSFAFYYYLTQHSGLQTFPIHACTSRKVLCNISDAAFDLTYL